MKLEYIVLDLEWNQGKYAKELTFEIIEIGAVKLDEKRNVIDTFHRIIRPVVYPRLYEITKQLIELTEAELKQGVSFEEAAEDFLEWCGEDYKFCIWGSSDLVVLQQNLDYYYIGYTMDYPLFYYDVQQLFGIAHEEEQSARNLEYAVRELKLPMDRPFHGALHDAQYTAEVFGRINPKLVSKYPALDTYHYPEPDEEAITVQYPDYRMTVSRTCFSRSEVKHDKQMVQLYCCICGRKAKRLVPWFSGGSRSYNSLGQCKVHGYLKGRLVIKNPVPEDFYGVQTIRLATEEDAAKVMERYKERNKKKKK